MRMQQRDGANRDVAQSHPNFNYSPVIAQNPDNVAFVSEDEYLLYNLSTRKLHRLNHMAALVYELFSFGRSLQQVRGLLHSLWTATEPDEQPLQLPILARAVERWIHQACLDNLLLQVSANEQFGKVPGNRASKLLRESSLCRDEGSILAALVCMNEATTVEPENQDHWSELGELATYPESPRSRP